MGTRFKDVLASDFGVELGKYGDPIAPIYKALIDKGLPITPGSVSKIRMEYRNGGGTYRQYCEKQFEQNGASLKDNLYRNITLVGELTPFTHPGSSYSADIAKSPYLNTPPQMLRRQIRAMRAEYVLAEKNGEVGETGAFFIKSANEFLDTYSLNPQAPFARPWSFVSQRWKGQSAEQFYRLVYQEFSKETNTVLSPRVMIPWLKRELASMGRFYQCRQDQGSDLSVFDRQVITATRGNTELDTAKEIKKTTGVAINGNDLVGQYNALVFGLFSNPLLEH
jgi:hypothetical protein